MVASALLVCILEHTVSVNLSCTRLLIFLVNNSIIVQPLLGTKFTDLHCWEPVIYMEVNESLQRRFER
jgi:hypothetical protein